MNRGGYRNRMLDKLVNNKLEKLVAASATISEVRS